MNNKLQEINLRSKPDVEFSLRKLEKELRVLRQDFKTLFEWVTARPWEKK